MSTQFNYVYAVQLCLRCSTMSTLFNYVYAVKLCLRCSTMSTQFNYVYAVQLSLRGSTMSTQLKYAFAFQLRLNGSTTTSTWFNYFLLYIKSRFRFVSHTELKHPQLNLLPNDTLTILCEISITGDNIVTSGSSKYVN